MVEQKQERKTVRQKMMDLLSDGCLHSVEELQKCLYDELSSNAVRQHISVLRDILSPQGHGIVSHKENGTTWYQIVRLIRRY